MANKKISELTLATSLNNEDLLVTVQGSATKKVLMSTVKDACASSSIHELTLTTTWVEDSSGYLKQDVAIADVTENDVFEFTPKYANNKEQDEAINTEYNKLANYCNSATNKITFYASEATTSTLTLMYWRI